MRAFSLRLNRSARTPASPNLGRKMSDLMPSDVRSEVGQMKVRPMP